MQGLTFRAWHDARYITLAEVIKNIGVPVADLTWKLDVEDASPGPRYDVLTTNNNGLPMATDELLTIVGHDAQIIDGTVAGYHESNPSDAVVIVGAVDSSDWDVYSEDIRVLDAIRRAFHDASPIPDD